MKRSVIKELIKQSMLEVAPKKDSSKADGSLESDAAALAYLRDREEEEKNKYAVGPKEEPGLEEDMSRADKVLNRPSNSITFEQMGMIMMLADELGENKEANEFLSGVVSKKAADQYIKQLIGKLDGGEGMMQEGMELPDDIEWDVEEVLDYYDHYSADLIVRGYSPSTGKTYGGSVVGTEAGGGDWDYYEGDIVGIEEMPNDDDILAEAEKIVAAWAEKKTLKEEMHGGYLELFEMNSDFEQGVELLLKAWNEWKEGPETEPEMIDQAREDIITYLRGELD
jgi:hypothetical protein